MDKQEAQTEQEVTAPRAPRMTPLERAIADAFLPLPQAARAILITALGDIQTVRRDPFNAAQRTNAALRFYGAQLFSGAVVDKESVAFAQSLDSRNGDAFIESLFDRLGGDGYTLTGTIFKGDY